MEKRKRGNCLGLFVFYGFFDSSRAITAPTTTIATMTPMIAGRKYRSAIDGACVGAGVAVAAASWMLNVVSCADGQ